MKNFTNNFIKAINYLKSSNSQKNISLHIGLQPQSLSQIMKGKRAPTVDNISKLFTVYKINPIWIMTGKGKMIQSVDGAIDTTGQPGGEKPTEVAVLEARLHEKEKEIGRLYSLLKEMSKAGTNTEFRGLDQDQPKQRTA